MWLSVTLDISASVPVKEFLGSEPGDRFEGIKVNGVVENDTSTGCRLHMKGVT